MDAALCAARRIESVAAALYRVKQRRVGSRRAIHRRIGPPAVDQCVGRAGAGSCSTLSGTSRISTSTISPIGFGLTPAA